MTDMLRKLEMIIADRRQNPQPNSYTNTLFEKGRTKIAQKVGEEGVEVVIAALAQGRDEQMNEIADLLYHLLVLMNDLNLTLADIDAILKQRHHSDDID